MTNTRASAACVIDRVVTGRRSLDAALAGVLPELGDARERALVQELSYGTLRWYFELCRQPDGGFRMLPAMMKATKFILVPSGRLTSKLRLIYVLA